MHYDEIDISRSHISSVIGCWLLTRRPRSISCLCILDDRDAFEAEITADLDSARAHLTVIVNQRITLSAGVPTKPLSQLLTSARTWLDRTHLKPKTVYSDIINTHDHHSWHSAFPSDTCPTLSTLITDITTMLEALPLHPLCTTYATALSAAGTRPVTLRSLCLGHLDQSALTAASQALTTAGCTLGLTVNDSLTIYRPSPLTPPERLTIATQAASQHLG